MSLRWCVDRRGYVCAVAYLIVIVVSGRANVSALHMELSYVIC